ncbi:MAG: polyhydroxyalkanoic acid system family protein, partial [Candidatus Berkelbacteria bacterium]|nr:polyhydroxyalkanoic acid system family protein [Candidatus Berkelbacteria bacterium]
LGWEFIALILAIISHLPGLKKVKYASIFIFEAAIISFMITEPFAKFFGITTSMTWFIPILISFLAYIIVSHLRKGKSVFQGDTPWELTLQGILILVVSVPLVISTNYISIAWTVIGFSLILIGFLLTDSSVRTFGISIIFLTIFKILLGDVATSSYANLIFSLFVMAPVLIITSLIYQRLHQRKFRPNIIVERPHSLTVFEAASRLEGLTKALEDKYAGIFTNLEKHWNENRTIIGFSFDAFAMHVEGQIKIEEKKAILEVQLPWIAMVFKEQIVSSVDREVGNLLEC